MEIPLAVAAEGHTAGPLALSLAWSGALPEGWTATLVDRTLGSATAIVDGGTYAFTLDVAAGKARSAALGLDLMGFAPEAKTGGSADSGDRFALKITPASATSTDGTPEAAFGLGAPAPNPGRGAIRVPYTLSASGDATGLGVRRTRPRGGDDRLWRARRRARTRRRWTRARSRRASTWSVSRRQRRPPCDGSPSCGRADSPEASWWEPLATPRPAGFGWRGACVSGRQRPACRASGANPTPEAGYTWPPAPDAPLSARGATLPGCPTRDPTTWRRLPASTPRSSSTRPSAPWATSRAPSRR